MLLQGGQGLGRPCFYLRVLALYGRRGKEGHGLLMIRHLAGHIFPVKGRPRLTASSTAPTMIRCIRPPFVAPGTSGRTHHPTDACTPIPLCTQNHGTHSNLTLSACQAALRGANGRLAPPQEPQQQAQPGS